MKKLSLKEKISYGFGDFGNGFMFDLGQAYLSKFFTDVCGIPAAQAKNIFVFTKIFDAFMDPIAGSVIDARKPSKTGKFRPVMMISSIILAALTVFTFTMPDMSVGNKLIYAYAAYMIWGLVYSFTNIPYGSLASVMTQDVNDRSQMATFRQAGSLGAQLITGVAFVPILTHFTDPKIGYPIAAAIMALIGIIAFFICFKNTREHIQPKAKVQEKLTFADYKGAIFANKPLIAIIIMTLFTISAMNANNQMMIYYCQYALGNVELQPVINTIMIGCSIIGIAAIPKLVSKFGKKKTAMIGFAISIVANGLNFILPANFYTFTALVTIGYIGLAIPNGVTWAMVSDCIDYSEWNTGKRKEGIIYSAFNFARKIAQSLAAYVTLGALGLTGYVPNAVQTSSALFGMKAVMALYPAVALTLAAIVVFVLYDLTDEKFNSIVKELQEGKFRNN
ncbi:glycoside-pentoside-hexuronide (GPH):cation symporter [Clostridium sp. SHJSY1]|uniref:glycoside-pentoside-hexuronide (GPH):cation symporter n=1 Tax=Clostridium sp. SHJSY1 TaxID=2942483 RepID=UPI0028769C9E|nr:glycoside-pentoside-hexuronide (GPH):cation symporter [Clostridium sp. SHJSY1]MDS0525995.1 glycoside-pentoside-hexuronide (GPH):cation symporter [Clostridium sp. SHJSY1]